MIEFVTKLEELPLTREEIEKLSEVTAKFPFRANKYYLSLIDWNDPRDPIRRIIVPSLDELDSEGSLDPSDEKSYTVLPGIEHKYRETVLMIVSMVCGGICRFCFRKRLFRREHHDQIADINSVVPYIKNHMEVTDVLLTGGDPLILPTSKLKSYIKPLLDIEHVKVIRLGTKIPAFYPMRITEDKEFLEFLKEVNRSGKRVYVMTHFSHPRELTKQARLAIDALLETHSILCNQTPIIRGVNDSPEVLSTLFRELTSAGSTPYYCFQNRPALGNRKYSLPVETTYHIVESAKARCSGIAKRVRLIMSHKFGKIEVLGIANGKVFLKYHQAADPANIGKVMVFDSNPDAYWFDDYLNQLKVKA